LRLDSEQILGEPLLFYVVGNKSNIQSKIEENLLPGVRYFILGPGAYFDDGYIFGFQNASYENMESVNRLNGFDIYAFPAKMLPGGYLIGRDGYEGIDIMDSKTILEVDWDWKCSLVL